MAKNLEKWRAKQERKAARQAAKAERRLQRRKAEAVLGREQIAAQLRALADQVEAGTFTLGDLEMDLPAQAEFEIGYKPKKRGGHQIEVEIEWGRPTDAPLLPTEG